MVTAGAIHASTAIDLDPPDDISFIDNFLFEDDFSEKINGKRSHDFECNLGFSAHPIS